MEWDDEEQDGESQDDENGVGFDDFTDEPPRRKESLFSRLIARLESGWRSLRFEERRITLADVLRLLICIALAMTLATAGIGLIRFSMTREGAIFWMVLTVIIFFMIRKRIFPD